MPNTTTPQPTPNDPSVQYGPVFARYLTGALRQSLLQVQAHRYTVPEDVRVQAWHMLTLTLDADDLWEETSELLIELAPRMEMAGFRDDWISFLEAGIEWSTKRNDELIRAKQLYYLGQLCRLMGIYDKAKNHLQQCERISFSIDESNWQAMALNELAYLAFDGGDYPEVKWLAQEAITLFDEAHPEVGMSYYHLGRLAEENSQLESARSYYELALKVRRSHDDQRWIATGLRNLGIIYTKEKKYNKALVVLQEALESHKFLGDNARNASTLISIGIVLHDLKRYDDSLAIYFEAKTISEQLLAQDSLATIFNNMGMTYKALGHWQTAIDYTNAAINIRRLNDSPYRLANAMDTLGQIYMDQGNDKPALDTFEDALEQIRDLPNAALTSLYCELSKQIEIIKRKFKEHA